MFRKRTNRSQAATPPERLVASGHQLVEAADEAAKNRVVATDVATTIGYIDRGLELINKRKTGKVCNRWLPSGLRIVIMAFERCVQLDIFGSREEAAQLAAGVVAHYRPLGYVVSDSTAARPGRHFVQVGLRS